MIARILITALIASILSGASVGVSGLVGAGGQAPPSTPTTAEIQTLTFQATVHDTGSYNGFQCDFAEDQCTKYKAALCEFIRQPLKPIQVPLTGFCTVDIASNRSVDNTLKVKVTLKFYDKIHITGTKAANSAASAEPTTTPEWSFKSSCATFGGALNQTFVLLRNSPELSVQITKFMPVKKRSTRSKDPFAITVEGELFENGQAVPINKWNPKDICAARSQITNMNMDGDLMDVIYTYGDKIVRNFKVKTDKGKTMASFTVQYPKSFFDGTGMDTTCDVINNLQWGFTKPLSTKDYYLGGTPTVTEAQKTPAEPEPVKTITFEYTAIVKDGGSLDGQTCPNPTEPCLGYKKAVCKLAEKALICGRLPAEGEVCSAVILNKKAADSLEAKVSLQLLPTAEKLYNITETCPTFGALYAQTYASYDVPTLNLAGSSATKEQTPTTGELEKFQIDGTLMLHSEAVQWSTWTLESYQNLEHELLNFHMSDDLIKTFYRAKTSLTDLTVDKGSGEKVSVSFVINYEKSYIESAGIDPNCDLVGMLQWGFQNPEQLTVFTLGPDVTVTHLTKTPTQTTAATTEGTETTKLYSTGSAYHYSQSRMSGTSKTNIATDGGNLKHNSVMCLLIIGLIHLLQNA